MLTSAPVAVLLPTHDHASTLELAARSVLEQTYADLALVVIGDGIGDDTRDVLADLRRDDGRVVVVDRPKAPRHGERTRDEVIRDLGSPIVVYHGDDDLLLPHHVATMIELLAGHDFAHPLPIIVRGDDDLLHLPVDLSERAWVQWHLHPRRNTISLTGAAHTLDSYRRLPVGWRETPAGRWTDHYMWQQFFALPDLRAVTGSRATTVKLDAGLRAGDDRWDRLEEIERWWARMHAEGFGSEWEAMVSRAVREAANRASLVASAHEDQVLALTAERDSLLPHAEALAGAEARAAAATEQAEVARTAAESATHDLDVMSGSASWRVTAPLRRLRSLW